ncbi:low temperature requirement protein A [Plantactinospora sp. KLBMP9567]|uniref:low temperature requirement protein A n=1 Tax=Plantactinospora sp. KLBMP9567 TaxID=3085900 RepID=UPI0039904385
MGARRRRRVHRRRRLARRGWRIVSAAHWTERYESVGIAAVGELIISVGAGTNPLSRPITWPVAGAAILAIIVTAALGGRTSTSSPSPLSRS